MIPVQKLAAAGIKASVVRMPWGTYWHTDLEAKNFREGHVHKDFGFIFEWTANKHPVRII